MKWFKHDSRANRDAKIEKLMLKYGADGYALYWLCLELIADGIEKDNITFELEHDAEILGARLKIDRTRVEEIMGWMINADLFEESGGRITCLKLAERLDNAIVKSPEVAMIKEKIRENPGKSGIIPENSGQIRLDKNRLEEIRVDEIKGTDKPARAPKKPALVTEGKVQYLKYVWLYPEEYRKLIEEYGLEKTEGMIKILDLYYPDGKKCKEYTDHYRVMKRWVAGEWDAKHGKAPPVVHRQEDAGEHNARIKAQMLEKLRNGNGGMV